MNPTPANVIRRPAHNTRRSECERLRGTWTRTGGEAATGRTAGAAATGGGAIDTSNVRSKDASAVSSGGAEWSRPTDSAYARSTARRYMLPGRELGCAGCVSMKCLGQRQIGKTDSLGPPPAGARAKG